MKERPILFSAPMVRAILEGRKTQTRRLMKPQPSEDFAPIAVEWYSPAVETRDGDLEPGRPIFGVYGEEEGYRCRHGAPGDRLWVKEAWQALKVWIDPETGYGEDVDYAIGRLGESNPNFPTIAFAADSESDPGREDRGFPWRPSIFMPRWVSRITLEVMGVRVERLQAISEEDAIAEGVEGDGGHPERGCFTFRSARDAFFQLWEDINGDRAPWASDPWVWVIEFRRLEAAERAA